MAVCSGVPNTVHAEHQPGASHYDLVPPSTPAGIPAGPTNVPVPTPNATVNVGETAGPIMQTLHWVVTTAFGWLVGLAGITFDYSISAFTIGFGALYESSNLGFTINAIWGTVRDIFNLTFIFGLVYIGFKMILDSSDSNARKMLISLLGAALLVNFSLFITKFVIDFSNIAAFKVYQAFEQVSGDQVASIGSAFMELLGVSGALGVPYTASGGFAYIIGLMILLMVLTYVFFAGAILLLVRFVVLNIYMVFSPVMFLGWVFPSMAGQSKKYWNGFLSQAFFAPAFLFMIYLTYRVADAYNGGLQKDLGDAFRDTGGAGIAQVIPFFAMVIVFLLASMMVAKKMGGQGAAFSIGMADKAKNYAVGGMANAGRATLDRMARNDGHDENAPNPAMRRAGRFLARTATTFGARTALESAAKPYTSANKARSEAKAGLASRDSLARNEYDINAGLDALRTPEAARTSDQIAAIAKMQQLAPGLSIEQLEKMSDSSRVAIAPHITSSQAEKISESKELSSAQKKEVLEVRQAVIHEKTNQLESINKQFAANAAAIAAGNPPTLTPPEITALEKQKQDLHDTIGKYTIEQMEMMGEAWVNTQIASGTLKQTQMDDLKKSKKYAEGQRNSFSSKYNAQQSDSIKKKVGLNPGGAFNSVDFGKLSTAELEKMSVADLTNHAHYITESQMDSVIKNGKKFNDNEKRDLEAARKVNITNPAYLDQLFVHTDAARSPRNPADIAKIPANVIMSNLAAIIHHLSDPVLRELATKGKLSALEQQQIEMLVARYPGSAHPTAVGYFGSNHAATNWG